jgi:Uma2 family endonuclease
LATTHTRLMTFAEAERLPEPQGSCYELHHGELVEVPFPKVKHFLIQRQLRALLEQAAGESGIVEIEFGFRALPEHEYRRADVAFVSADRWRHVDPEGYFLGAPDLVIEVLSPSNSASEMLEKEKLCLENGCLQFWLVDGDHRQVKVTTSDGRTVTYKSGQEIPLLFGGTLAVDAIFS